MLSSAIFSQQLNKKVIDEKGEAIAYANIVVSSVNDSVFIYGTISDSLGRFTIPDENQKVILKVSNLGHETFWNTVRLKDINDIVLKNTSYILNGVEVTAKKRIFDMKGASVIASIENSVLGKMDKLINVLPYIPYVQILQGEVQVLGRGKALIYINNRPLSDNQELSRIDAADIKNIEVITSPGAEYDASVNAVIKIKVKRKQGEGMSGDLNFLLAQNTYTSENGSLNLNYRRKQLDIFCSVGVRDTRTKKEVDKNSILNNNSEIWSQMYSSNGKDHWLGIDGDAGFNFELSENTDFGGKYTFVRSPKLTTTSSITEKLYEADAQYYDLQSNSTNERKLTTHSANIYFNGKLSNKTDIKINADFSTSNDKTEQNVFETYNSGKKRTVLSNGSYNYNFYAGKILFEHQLKIGKINFGGEYSYTDYKQDYINHTPELEATMPASESHSRQNISALFSEYSLNIGTWNIIAGLRYEHTSFDYKLNKIKQEDQSKYDNKLFPSFSLSGSIKKVNMSLSYNNKITRPGYYLLRGNMEYNSPFDYSMGNPDLKATIRHSITSMFSYKDFQAMITYNYQKSPIISIVEQYNQEPIILTHPVNIKKSQNIQIAGQWSKTIKCWTPFISASITKPFLQLNLNNESYKFNHMNATFSFNNLISLPKDLYLYLNGTYNTKGHYTLYMYKPDGELQIGVSKGLFQNKLNVSLWYIDVLKTNKSRYDLYLSNLHINGKTYQGSSMGMISVVYRFNSTRTRYNGTGASLNEKNRL